MWTNEIKGTGSLTRLGDRANRTPRRCASSSFVRFSRTYRRNVIEGCRPFLSRHFNLTVELPLKTIVRGYSWTVIPITWRNRCSGISKLKIKEMGSRYLFIALYCWLERHFSCGDYRKETVATPSTKAAAGSALRT